MDDRDVIAEFLRRRGATRCPCAFVAPTRATIARSDARKVRRHEAELEAAATERRRRPPWFAHRAPRDESQMVPGRGMSS